LIRRIGDTHVVRHDVDDNAHTELLRPAGEHAKSVSATDFRIDSRVIDYVIAMPATRSRLGYGRSVAVAYAEPMEILYYRSRVNECEIAGELETIRRRGDASAHRQNRPGIGRLAPWLTRAAAVCKDGGFPSLITKALEPSS
jgi:hypothetical protein